MPTRRRKNSDAQNETSWWECMTHSFYTIIVYRQMVIRLITFFMDVSACTSPTHQQQTVFYYRLIRTNCYYSFGNNLPVMATKVNNFENARIYACLPTYALYFVFIQKVLWARVRQWISALVLQARDTGPSPQAGRIPAWLFRLGSTQSLKMSTWGKTSSN